MDAEKAGADTTEGKKKSSLLSWLLIISVSGLIGFVTIIPGKTNNIREFPSLEAILHREIFFLGVPVLVAIGVYFFNKSWQKKNPQ
jgi:hypothetical protein